MLDKRQHFLHYKSMGKFLGNRRRIIQKGMVKSSQISSPSEILSYSLLPASLMKICRRTGQLAWNRAFPFWSILESYMHSYQTRFNSNQRLCKNWHCKNLTQKHSVCDLDLKVIYWDGDGTAYILDTALSSRHKWKTVTEIVKNWSQNVYIKTLSVTLTLK